MLQVFSKERADRPPYVGHTWKLPITLQDDNNFWNVKLAQPSKPLFRNGTRMHSTYREDSAMFHCRHISLDSLDSLVTYEVMHRVTLWVVMPIRFFQRERNANVRSSREKLNLPQIVVVRLKGGFHSEWRGRAVPFTPNSLALCIYEIVFIVIWFVLLKSVTWSHA